MNHLKKVSILFFLTLTLLFFNNFTSNTIPKSKIKNFAFGPSPISEDGRTIFNLSSTKDIVHDTFWKHIRTKMNTIFIHSLFLDHLGLYQKRSPELVALNENQIQGLIEIQKKYNFNVSIDAGLSLGSSCSDTLPAWQIADNAVQADILLLKRFFEIDGIERKNKLIINAINIDGPILRVIKGSKKDHSCDRSFINGAWVSTNKGYDLTKSVEVVGRYMSRLQREIKKFQNGVEPKINIVINLPNWNAGGYKGYFDIDLVPTYEAFINSPFYPSINEVGIDYPYGFVAGDQRAFNAKVNTLLILMKRMRGNPKFGIIANQQYSLESAIQNAEDDPNMYGSYRDLKEGYDCIQKGKKIPLILTYSNRCLSKEMGTNYVQFIPSAQKLISYGDIKYIAGTIDYHKLIVQLNKKIPIESVYYESWYEFPSNSKVFGVKLTDLLSR